MVWLGYLFLFFDIELHELFVYFGGYFFVSCFVANIFSHFEGCLFVLFIISYTVHKLFSLIRSRYYLLFLFIYFNFHYSKRWVRKDPAVIYVKEYSAVLSSKSFIVSGFLLRTSIHFEFIFVYGVKKCSDFVLLCVVLPGEISITSDMQMTPPLWQKVKRN